MSNNFIIFIIFISLIGLLISEAISIYIIKEKGRKTWEGIVLGLLPIIGHIIAAFLKATDTFLINEMYQRNLMTKKEYEQTIKMKLKNKKE